MALKNHSLASSRPWATGHIPWVPCKSLGPCWQDASKLQVPWPRRTAPWFLLPLSLQQQCLPARHSYHSRHNSLAKDWICVNTTPGRMGENFQEDLVDRGSMQRHDKRRSAVSTEFPDHCIAHRLTTVIQCCLEVWAVQWQDLGSKGTFAFNLRLQFQNNIQADLSAGMYSRI